MHQKITFLLLAFVAWSTLAAQSTVSGTVTDAEGETLIGVNVLVSGTSSGTVTDFEGNYSLTVPAGAESLDFSYIGFESQTVPINGREIINVTLAGESSNLNTVVVVGYGTSKKADLTGSVASINTEDIQQISVGNVANGIKGRVPGMDISTTDASPGASPNIKIRGHNTISGSNSPLIVVDGFTRIQDLSILNPRDIKGIEVLKDASATAIYGARGAGGVILVTTFEGDEGPAVIKLSTAVQSKEIRRKIPLFNGSQFRELRREAGFIISDDEIANAPTTDWQDLVYRPGLEQNYQLSYSGGSENTRYYVSGNYFDDKGIVENSFYDRYSLRGRVTTDIRPWMTVGTTIYHATSKANGTARNNIGYIFDPSLSTSALTFYPDLPVRNADGTFTSTETTTNPVAIATERTDLEENRLTYLYGTLDVRPFPTLTLRSTFGVVRRDRVDKEYWPSTVTNITDQGAARVINSADREWSNENIFIYKPNLGPHNLELTGGFTQEFARYESFGSQSAGFLTDDLTVFNLGGNLDEAALTIGSNAFEDVLQSFLGRVTYNYKNKYYLTGSFRREGSSRFSTNNQWGNFPGVAVAWRPSEEGFMANFGWLDNLKLRASWGINGNFSALGFYESQLSFVADGVGGATIFNDVAQPSLRLLTLANENLKWETSEQYNIGFDVAVLDERVSMIVDAYVKTTRDLLLNVQVPSASGVSSFRDNVGSIENRGLEISLQTRNVVKPNLTWTTTFNYSFFRNKVLDLGDQPFFTVGPNAGLFDSNPMIIQEGKPLGSFFGYVHEGIFPVNPTDSRIDYTPVLNVPNLEGYRRLADVNGDNRVTPEDRTIIGSAQPDFSFGFINDFTFGNFDASIYIQGVIGQDVYNLTRYYTESTNLSYNVTTTVADRWTPENREGRNIPGVGRFNNFAHSFNVEDGSYVKFRDIQLGYSVPTPVLKRVGIGRARVFASLQNFIVITDYSGYDPEVNLGGGSTQLQNLDLGAYPTTRSATFGLDLTF